MATAASVAAIDSAQGHGVILFDGDCGACSGLVRFVFEHDRRAHFRFTPLQSDVGRELLARHRISREADTVVLIEGDSAFTRSTAVLRIAWRLGWPWQALAALLAVPTFVRDPLYAAFARNRYRFAVRRGKCALSPRGLRERLLDRSG